MKISAMEYCLSDICEAPLPFAQQKVSLSSWSRPSFGYGIWC